MKSTGIVRRIDDLGRIVIPKEIRRTMRIREGDPLELFLDGNNIVFHKYEVSEEDLALSCRNYIAKMSNYIQSVTSVDRKTIVVFTNGKVATVKQNKDDTYDMNTALCYAFAQAGFTSENPVCE